jgi:cystathionine gamma-synthase
MEKNKMHPATKAIHSGYHADGPNQPVVPPLHTSTIWTHPETGLNRGPGSYAYTRFRNPNRSEFEDVVTALENGATSIAFSSGMAAIASVFQAYAPGDHIVVCDDVYFGTRQILSGMMNRWGLQVTYADARNPQNIMDAITPKTKLIWLESPSNPMLYITDIRKVCEIVCAGTAGKDPSAYIRICVDNTWATPLLQNPLDLGADLVMHSASKYFSGHSDILAGVITCKHDDDFAATIRENQRTGGAVLSPFDAWMLVRSVKSLYARMKIHCENARLIAEYLRDHPKVEAVFYPGFADSEGHAVAKSQMSDFGGMVSALFVGKKEQIVQGITRARLFKVATSLGGVESTWENRKSSEGETSKTPDNLIRISVGIEDPRDLIADIDQVLEAL